LQGGPLQPRANRDNGGEDGDDGSILVARYWRWCSVPRSWWRGN